MINTTHCGVSDISGGVLSGSNSLTSHNNTLPARVNGINGPSSNSNNKIFGGPTGRHFKPFDHRKMNPMADIQEDPYEAESPYGSFQKNENTTYVVHHNNHI